MNPRLFESVNFLKIREGYHKTDRDLRLRQAARAGDVEEVKNLLREGKLEVNAAQVGINPINKMPFSGKTALHQALEKQHIDVAEILIQAGWNIYFKDSKGNYPISFVNNDDIKTRLNVLNSWRILEKNLKKVFAIQQLKNRIHKNTLKVLSLACGLAVECNVLKDIFSDERIHYTGIDIDKTVCTTSQNMCGKYSNVKIIQADATNLEAVKNHLNNERFDIVILRQPNIIYMENVFSTIAKKIIPEVISPEGILFVSTYHIEELKKLNEYLPDFDLMENSSCELEDNEKHSDIANKIEVGAELLLSDKYSALWACNHELQLKIRNTDLRGSNFRDMSRR